MKLTKKPAIELTQWMWGEMAETGETKEEWIERHPQYEELDSWCFLREYANQFGFHCGHCPYFQKFGGCCDEDAPYDKWYEALTPKTRKKYAKLFLEQLKQL